MNISILDPKLIPLVWNNLLPLLELAAEISPKDVSLEVVKKQVISGQVKIVIISEGKEIIALHTIEVRILDTGIRALYIPLTAGTKMDEWIDEFLESIETIAIEQNCTLIRGGSSRKGWPKVLNNHGWKVAYTIFEKEVKE